MKLSELFFFYIEWKIYFYLLNKKSFIIIKKHINELYIIHIFN